MQPEAGEAKRRVPNRWLALPAGVLTLGTCVYLGVRALTGSAPLPNVRMARDSTAVDMRVPVPSATAQPMAATTQPMAATAQPAAPGAQDTAVPSAAPSTLDALRASTKSGATEEAAEEQDDTRTVLDQHTPRARREPVEPAELARPASRAGFARRIEPLREPVTHDEPEVTAVRSYEGVLQINSRPWARVLLDGRFVGHTPQLDLRLAEGRHHVRLVNEQMDMGKVFDVTIKAGQIVRRVELLDDNASSLR
jgi:hypothetical protein